MFSGLARLIQQLWANFRALFQRDPDRFIQHLITQTDIITEGLEALVVYMHDPTKKNAKRIRRLEKNADEIRRILLDELNRTFVTPIDREDLSMLSRDLDDVIDYAWSAVNEMDILDVGPNTYLQQMSELVRDGADELRLAVVRLSEHPRVANEHAVRALAVSNRMEELYANALSDLFDESKKQIDGKTIINMMKLRESYRHMFRAARSVSKAGNTIVDIVVKFF